MSMMFLVLDGIVLTLGVDFSMAQLDFLVFNLYLFIMTFSLGFPFKNFKNVATNFQRSPLRERWSSSMCCAKGLHGKLKPPT